MPLYAAYGSNMDPRRMLERCPHSPLDTTGWLTGWRLTFGGEEHGWDGALPTIVQDPLEQVFVAVYDVSREDESALDAYEGGLPSASYVGVLAEAAQPQDVVVGGVGGLPCRSSGL